ncbi:MAG: hypothetical protein IBX50_03640 [Marinospirillum sp.]|uniref:hypothetical protein n=1 Tax=Marinospirillum sp. TaxID=2183934 RepID=UPI0019FC6098|nr:hypothetical protein [Marinospirillum sp.]MBE0505796.1 hypothetical protein [Marinospirillum sp.]
MLGKILVTALVFGVVYILWRHQQRQQELEKNEAAGHSSALPSSRKSPAVKPLLIGILALFMLSTAAWMVYDWQDQRTLLEVRVMNPTNGTEDIYQVYKKDLQERGFTTRNGQHIRIANSERMEVQRLGKH